MNPVTALVQASIALQDVSQNLLTDCLYAFGAVVVVYTLIDVLAGIVRVRCAKQLRRLSR